MKSPTENRKPYAGLVRSLVIAIDVGTTFSGVSYAILEPGEIPKIHGVTRFPGQEHAAGNTKIPSIIYYDRFGKMMAAGAEATTTTITSLAEDEDWIKTDLFKLRLRPRTMQLNMNGMRLGSLPRRKTAVHVFGDFLAYMYRCTRDFIIDTHGNGSALWNAVENDVQLVLSHPNGWEGAQQTKMRRAAVYGGLIPDTDEGRARIRFVTEGEASLHACVLSGLAADVLSDPSKHGFLIADAGGGTLDISAYSIRQTSPLMIEEIAPPDCIFAGSVFVSRRAREFLEEKLKKSKYGASASLDHITQRFDETTKRLFRAEKDSQFIAFGSPLDKDSAVGIRNGQLKLTGNEVANLFEPSVDAAFNALRAQIDISHGMIRSVFLVGGYAASPWLFSQLQERLAPFKVTVSRPDTMTSKAVADGAIGFYCDHHVSARMSRFLYGVEFLREMDPKDPDHISRLDRLCQLPSGPRLLPDAFDCILRRGVKVKESTVFTRKYCTELTNLTMLSVFEVEIWCYRGGGEIPKWIDRQADDFSTLCAVRADLSPLSNSAEPKTGQGGKLYWLIVFSIEIHFGLTEFKARIKWIEDGKIKYGPASIIYNERGHRTEEEEPDVFSEDDAGTPRNDRLKSEPGSRARTPTDFPDMAGNAEREGASSPQLPARKEKLSKPPTRQHSRAPSASLGARTRTNSIASKPTVGISTSNSEATEVPDNEKGKVKENATVNNIEQDSSHPTDLRKTVDQLASAWEGKAGPSANQPPAHTPKEAEKGAEKSTSHKIESNSSPPRDLKSSIMGRFGSVWGGGPPGNHSNAEVANEVDKAGKKVGKSSFDKTGFTKSFADRLGSVLGTEPPSGQQEQSAEPHSVQRPRTPPVEGRTRSASVASKRAMDVSPKVGTAKDPDKRGNMKEKSTSGKAEPESLLPADVASAVKDQFSNIWGSVSSTAELMATVTAAEPSPPQIQSSPAKEKARITPGNRSRKSSLAKNAWGSRQEPSTNSAVALDSQASAVEEGTPTTIPTQSKPTASNPTLETGHSAKDAVPKNQESPNSQSSGFGSTGTLTTPVEASQDSLTENVPLENTEGGGILGGALNVASTLFTQAGSLWDNKDQGEIQDAAKPSAPPPAESTAISSTRNISRFGFGSSKHDVNEPSSAQSRLKQVTASTANSFSSSRIPAVKSLNNALSGINPSAWGSGQMPAWGAGRGAGAFFGKNKAEEGNGTDIELRTPVEPTGSAEEQLLEPLAVPAPQMKLFADRTDSAEVVPTSATSEHLTGAVENSKTDAREAGDGVGGQEQKDAAITLDGETGMDSVEPVVDIDGQKNLANKSECQQGLGNEDPAREQVGEEGPSVGGEAANAEGDDDVDDPKQDGAQDVAKNKKQQRKKKGKKK